MTSKFLFLTPVPLSIRLVMAVALEIDPSLIHQGAEQAFLQSELDTRHGRISTQKCLMDMETGLEVSNC